jgi:hypothetical protein
MPGTESHINIERLRRYYGNEMSQIERHQLEADALEDPFLKDAMDGFDDHPSSFEQFYQRHKVQLKPRNSYTFILALGGLLALFVTVALITLNQPKVDELVIAPSSQFDTLTTFDSDREIEMIIPSIDSMIAIPENEQIKTVDVISDQAKLKILEPKNVDTELIEVPEIIQNTPDKLETEKEDWNWYKSNEKGIPTAYVHGFKVVDYREIKRENEKISYKRYELGGVAANQESENSVTELIEQEVEVPYFTYLTKTMSFFQEENFKASLNRHLIILEQYHEDLNALFYSGLAYYNLGKYEESIRFFAQIMLLDNQIFNQEAEWYRAKCLIQLGRKKEVKTALEEIIMKGGFYVEDAIALKSKINL